MHGKSLTVEGIQVEVTGFFTTHHTFQTQVGKLGELTFPAFAQGARYRSFDGRDLVMEKPRWLGTAHELRQGETLRGRADQPGCFRQDYAILFDGQRYSLDREGLLSQRWFLYDEEGRPLLALEPRGVFKTGSRLTLWGAVDSDLVAFAYYLYYTRQQEQAAAVAATSSAAVAS